MSRRICAFCIASFVFATSASAAITNLISSAVEGVGIAQEFAVTRQKLTTYFEKGDKPTDSLTMYSRSAGGGVRLTLIGRDFGAARVGAISMNDNGKIAMQGVSSNPLYNGIFAMSAGGGVPLTITGDPFGSIQGAPVVGADDTIYYRGTGGIYARSSGGGILLTVRGQDFAQMNRPSVSPGGDIAFSGVTTGGVEGIFVQPRGGGQLLTINGSNFKLTSGQPKIIDNKKSVLVPLESLATGETGLYLAELDATGGYSTSLLSPIALGDVGRDCYINGLGTVLQPMGGSIVIHPRDVFSNFAPGYSTQTIVSVGDSLDGSTVAALSLSDSSLLDDNSVAFWAQLANGQTGIYLASVPEPSILGISGLLAVFLRRRR